MIHVELAAIVASPFSRPITWALLLGAIPTSAIVWTWLSSLPMWAAVPLAYLAAVLLLTGVWLLIAPRVEDHSFKTATYRWYEPGCSGAYARVDRKGRLNLYSVWADPRGHGIGSRLMRQIICDTQPAGDLWLVAANGQVADFYARLGFRHVGRALLGHRMVLERVVPPQN